MEAWIAPAAVHGGPHATEGSGAALRLCMGFAVPAQVHARPVVRDGDGPRGTVQEG